MEVNKQTQKLQSIEEKQIIIFLLGKEEYAVPILQVQEIVHLPERITKVPNTPDFVEGVMNLRGEIIPVINLHKRFAIESPKRNEKIRVLIIKIGSQYVGIITDEVIEVRTFLESEVISTPEMFSQIDYEYLSGIIKVNDRLIILLDLTRIFSDIEKTILDWTTKKMKFQHEITRQFGVENKII